MSIPGKFQINRLKRKVVFLSVCIVFGLLFSKPAHQLAQTAVDRAAAFLGIQSLGFNSTVAVDDNVNNGKSDDLSRTTKATSKDSIKGNKSTRILNSRNSNLIEFPSPALQMKLIMLISTIVSHFYEQYCPPGDDLVSRKYIILNKAKRSAK